MKLVAIVGQKRSGKDTLADMFARQFSSDAYALADPIKEVLFDAYEETDAFRASGVKLTYDDFNGQGIDREKPLLLSNLDVKNIMTKSLAKLQMVFGLKKKVPLIRDDERKTFEAYVDLVVMTNETPWSIRRLMQTLGTDIVVNHIDYQFWNRTMMVEYFDKTSSGYADYFVIKDIRQDHELKLMRDLGAIIIFVERPDINKSTDEHITESGLTPNENDIVIINDGTLNDLETKLKEVISCQMK